MEIAYGGRLESRKRSRGRAIREALDKKKPYGISSMMELRGNKGQGLNVE